MTVTTTGTLRASTYALMKLLRDNASVLQQRVYPPGVVESAMMPRATVTQYTPKEQIDGLGASVTSFSQVRFKVNIYHKDPGQIDPVSDSVIQAVKQNRNYAPAAITIGQDAAVDPKGKFYQLAIDGGGEVSVDNKTQLYFRSIIVSGVWHQTS